MNKLSFTLGFLLVGVCMSLIERPIRHEDDMVIRINKPEDTVRYIIQQKMDILEQTYDYVEVRATQEDQTLLRSFDVEFEVIFDNLQKLIDEETLRLNNRPKNQEWFDDYHTYEEIKEWFQDLAANNGNVTYYDSIGKSIEGRDIFALRLSSDESEKPAVYIESLQHAREWISGPVVQYLCQYILDGNAGDLLDRIELYVVPIVNPDGYEYTWTNDRLWRKNRRNNGGSYGVDLNRNWDIEWAQGGSSSVPASDTYHGTAPFSEPETTAVSEYFKSHNSTFAAIDFHAYSQLILRPYGYQRGDALHEPELFEAAEIMQNEIRNVHGKFYQNIHSIELYKTTGTASDYFYNPEVAEIFGRYAYGYTFELRPSSPIPGFLLPPSEIIPSGEEIAPAFVAFVEFALQNELPLNP